LLKKIAAEEGGQDNRQDQNTEDGPFPSLEEFSVVASGKGETEHQPDAWQKTPGDNAEMLQAKSCQGGIGQQAQGRKSRLDGQDQHPQGKYPGYKIPVVLTKSERRQKDAEERTGKEDQEIRIHPVPAPMDGSLSPLFFSERKGSAP